MTPSYQRKGGELKGVPSPILGPNKKDTLEEEEEAPQEKLFSVTEEDVEDVLPLEVREKLKGSQAPSQGRTKKILKNFWDPKPRLRAVQKRNRRAPDR